MDLIDVGINQGMRQGIQQGIKALIETCRELQVSRADTMSKIIQKFNLSEEIALEYMTKYWE